MGSFVGEPTSYTVRVTNLSTEVSEEDVVVCTFSFFYFYLENRNELKNEVY